MTRQKEIGYDIINVTLENLGGFPELWNTTEADTKDLMVEELGRAAEITVLQYDNTPKKESYLIPIVIGFIIGILCTLIIML